MSTGPRMRRSGRQSCRSSRICRLASTAPAPPPRATLFPSARSSPSTSRSSIATRAIIRRLEKSDGLVVQGPPGTGKTHTIANIICHMLATGRRVLVVSYGETALSVFRDQLPVGVRDLAISVTTSEREGLKQVEKAIGLMLGVVNTIDTNRSRQVKIIRDLESKIVADRNRLAEIDVRL